MDNARQQEYNLAYCKHYVDAFRINPVRAPLVYALLPAELGSFVGHLKIGTSRRRPSHPAAQGASSRNRIRAVA